MVIHAGRWSFSTGWCQRQRTPAIMRNGPWPGFTLWLGPLTFDVIRWPADLSPRTSGKWPNDTKGST